MTELGMQKNYCEWHLDDEDANNWVSACGGSFWFEEGDPKENKMKYCPYCGRHLTQRAADASPRGGRRNYLGLACAASNANR